MHSHEIRSLAPPRIRRIRSPRSRRGLRGIADADERPGSGPVRGCNRTTGAPRRRLDDGDGRRLATCCTSQRIGDVSAYAYPDGKLQGRLAGCAPTGSAPPRAAMSSFRRAARCLRYAHGGTRPIAVLANAPGGAAQFWRWTRERQPRRLGRYARFACRRLRGRRRHPQFTLLRKARGVRLARVRRRRHALRRHGFGRAARPGEGGVTLQRVAWNGARPARLDAIRWEGENLERLPALPAPTAR